MPTPLPHEALGKILDDAIKRGGDNSANDVIVASEKSLDELDMECAALSDQNSQDKPNIILQQFIKLLGMDKNI